MQTGKLIFKLFVSTKDNADISKLLNLTLRKNNSTKAITFRWSGVEKYV